MGFGFTEKLNGFASSHETLPESRRISVDFAGANGAAGHGLPVLLRRKGREKHRTHGGCDLVSLWRGDIGDWRHRRVQSASVAACADAARAASPARRGGFETV